MVGKWLFAWVGALLAAVQANPQIALAQPSAAMFPARIQVAPLAKNPVLDGSIAEWSTIGGGAQTTLITHASMLDSESNAAVDKDWVPPVKVRAGVFEDKLYMAFQWRDERADKVYRPWKKKSGKFRRDRKKDDMLAIRFPTGGDFDACMISGKDYKVDMWHWSAGRSNLAGRADDKSHKFSTSTIQDAVIYTHKGRDVYMLKRPDGGDPGWHYVRADKSKRDRIQSSVALENSPTGSIADVSAKGAWSDGVWTVEMMRKLQTDDSEDVIFKLGGEVIAQVAMFNAGYKMRKRVTDPFVLDFNARGGKE